MKKEEKIELINSFIKCNKENMENDKDEFIEQLEDFVSSRLDIICNKLEKVESYNKIQDKFYKTHDYISTKIPQADADELERAMGKMHEMEKVYIYLQGLIDAKMTEL